MKVILQTWSFHMHFHDILFEVDNFTSIILAIIGPVSDLGMSFRKV